MLPKELDTQFSVHLDKANELKEKKQFREALEFYKVALELDKDNVKIIQQIARLYENLQQIDEAINFYQKIVKLRPQNPKFLVKLAKIFKHQNRLDDIINLYQKAIEINPQQSFNVYYELAQALSQKKRFDAASSAYREAIRLKPDFHQAYYHLGLICLKQTNYDEAVDCFLKRNQIAPSAGMRFWNKLRLHFPKMSPQQLESAEQAFHKALESASSASSFLVHFGLGEILTQKGLISEAIKFYQKASYINSLATKPEFAKFVSSTSDVGNLRRPHFILIGFGKCGSTSLYDYIAQHPKILPAIEKEVRFFNRIQQIFPGQKEDINWYLAHFSPTPERGEFITGDGSPGYIVHSGIEQKVFEYFPNVKLIIIIRNPVKRSVSQYHHRVRTGFEERAIEEVFNLELTLFENLESPELVCQRSRDINNSYIKDSLYICHISKWMSLFPRENFLILTNEDLNKTPDLVMKETFEFLGLSNHRLGEYPRFKPGSYKPISDELHQRLSNFFKPYNKKLEEYLDREFNWES